MSLLKRIEQGQGKPGQPAAEVENPDAAATATTTSGDSATRLMTLQARRVAAPGSSSQRDTYLDLKTRVQNRLLSELDPGMDISRVQ